MIQLTSARLVVSLLITRTALHARCAMVMSSATMRVQSYAGSGTRSSATAEGPRDALCL